MDAARTFKKLEYTDEEYAQEIGILFPTFTGFSCLGEQYNSLHLNHTMVLVVFNE